MLGLVARRAAVNVPRVLARRGYAEVASNSDKLRLSLVLPHDVRQRTSLADCGPARVSPRGFWLGPREGSHSLWPSRCFGEKRLCVPADDPLSARSFQPPRYSSCRSSTRRRMSSRSTSPPSRVTSVCKLPTVSSALSQTRCGRARRTSTRRGCGGRHKVMNLSATRTVRVGEVSAPLVSLRRICVGPDRGECSMPASGH